MDGGKPVSVYEIEMLPKCMAISHGSCYLRSVHDSGSGGGSFVELGDGGGANNPRCRFYLEESKEHYDGNLMHVRCCYNNKYWVPQQREQDGWIIGTCDEPEEDLSKPSCTLFKLLIPEHEEHSIRF